MIVSLIHLNVVNTLKHSNTSTNITMSKDYLNEDPSILNQNWVCVSFLSPEGIRNCTVRGLKIRGVYSTKEEADKRAAELTDIDPDFHVFVGEVGKWLPWDPDPNSVTDQVYQEQELNNLMKGYKENMNKAEKMERQRKGDMIEKAAREEQSRNATHDRLKKKLEKRKAVKQEKLVEKSFEEKEKLIDAEKQRLDNVNTDISKSQGKVADIDNQLDHIKSLYDKLNKKTKEKEMSVSV